MPLPPGGSARCRTGRLRSADRSPSRSWTLPPPARKAGTRSPSGAGFPGKHALGSPPGAPSHHIPTRGGCARRRSRRLRYSQCRRRPGSGALPASAPDTPLSSDGRPPPPQPGPPAPSGPGTGSRSAGSYPGPPASSALLLRESPLPFPFLMGRLRISYTQTADRPGICSPPAGRTVCCFPDGLKTSSQPWPSPWRPAPVPFLSPSPSAPACCIPGRTAASGFRTDARSLPPRRPVRSDPHGRNSRSP